MNQYDIAIIGGGFGGISQGIFLQKCGYKTIILERTALPGGVATVWRRKGEYIFDGATNWLAGSAPSANLYFLLKDIIEFDKLIMIDPEEFIQIEHDGETLTLYNDLPRLENELLRISPEDSKHIASFIEAIKLAGTFGIPFETPPEIMTIPQKLKFVVDNFTFIKFFSKWKKISIEEFANGFKSQKLKELFKLIFPHHPFFSIYAVITTIAWMSQKAGGYPVGGGEKLLDVMIDTYRKNGGEFRLNSEVDEISIANNKANGVLLTNGEHISSNRVISTADGKLTIENLLKNKYRHKEIEQLLNSNAITYPGLIQISFVTNKIFGHLPHKLNIDFDTPLRVGKTEMSADMMIRTCPPESGLSPEGTTTFVIHIRVSDTEYWKDLRASDRDLYKQEKLRISEAIRKSLKNRFGEFTELYIDTATPATYERYSKAYRASYQGWAPTPKLIGKNLKKRFKGLKNFYIGGQWVWPAGGIPGVARVSRHITQIICKEDDRPFL